MNETQHCLGGGEGEVICHRQLPSSTPTSLRSPNMKRLPSQFNGRCVEVKSYADLYKFFTVSFWGRTAAWHRSHGCNCLARALKLKFNPFKRIVRWICGRGTLKPAIFGFVRQAVRNAVCHLALSL